MNSPLPLFVVPASVKLRYNVRMRRPGLEARPFFIEWTGKLHGLLINKPQRRRFVSALLIWGVALALLCSTPETLRAEASQIMPLAEKSLLLDGQIIGDRIIVVGERGHILTSEDNGKTWQQQEAPTRATLTSVFFKDPANGWAAGHDSLILQTIDGGRHWKEIYSDPEDERPILDLWFHDNGHGIAVGAYGLFLMTHDGGKSWETIDFAPATMISDENNNGDPWSEEDEEAWIDFHLNQVAVTGLGRVYVAAEAGNLYRSDDGCRSWLTLPSPYDGSFYGSLPLADNGSLLVYGLRGHLFRSDDNGNNWVEINTSTKSTLNDGLHLADGRIAIAGLAGALLLSEDNGHSFELYAQEDRAGIAKILQSNDGALILVGEHGVKRIVLPLQNKEAGQ